MSRLGLLISAILLLLALTAQAQDSCSAEIGAAFQSIADRCAALGRNQACYANALVEAVPREGIEGFSFRSPGDVVTIDSLQSLTLANRLAEADEWGAAVLSLQANLPDTLPGQNVILLLFGAVSIENATPARVTRDLVLTSNGRIRSTPTTQADNVLRVLNSGSRVTADGRTAAGDWIRIILSDGKGWVSSSVVSGDTDSLVSVAAEESFDMPMQAFYFTTGVGDRPCLEAPDSGILIQTPEGAGSVELLANGVHIALGSAAYLQASDGLMTVAVVEGRGIIRASGITQYLPAGTYSTIALDETGRSPSGTPTYPQPYDFERLKALPTEIALPRPVILASAVPQEQVAEAIQTTFAPYGALDGLYEFVRTSAEVFVEQSSMGYCANFYSSSFTARLNFSEDALTLIAVSGDPWFSSNFYNDGRFVLPRTTAGFGSEDSLHDSYAVPPRQAAAPPFWNNAETIKVTSFTELVYQRTESTHFRLTNPEFTGHYACRYTYRAVWKKN
ncbi:MAG: SH3 domain-containing protein [Anaerolineae bacterium]|nr:SH3 domain-containing protein [Anaerolineae bacterium]MDW8171659.1 SH3 domain-containing protein [Anaerolineae bacterium]